MNPPRCLNIARVLFESMDDNINTLAKIIWDFNVQLKSVEKSDCIIVLGSNDIRVAHTGADLYQQGFAPLVIFSGNVGRLSEGLWHRPEAEVFAEATMQRGIPRSVIIIENRSTNTGENLAFTKEILKKRRLDSRSFILVQKPYMLWRAWATFKKKFPGKRVCVTAPDITFDDYPNDVLSKDHIINVMVGDLQRLRIYPAKGFSVPVNIPRRVWHAYEQLVGLGYTRHLVPDD